MSADSLAYPDWTEYKKKSGLDPLGMQNSYQHLLPGISNVTLRVRYYGFYAWLASIYARRSGDTDPKAWQKFVRRAEAVYALAAQRRGNEGGMAGVQWAHRKLDADQESFVEFARLRHLRDRLVEPRNRFIQTMKLMNESASASHTSKGILSSQASINPARSRTYRGSCGTITPTSVK
jgi:hypothetical protein